MVIVVAFNFFGEGSVAARARLEASLLARHGHAVALVTCAVPAAEHAAREQFQRATGVGVVEIPEYYVRGPFFNVSKDVFFNLGLLRALRKLHAAVPLSLVVVHSSTACYATARFCRPRGIPTAFVIQALIWDRIASGQNPYGRVLTAAYRHANRHALRRLDWHLAISDYIRRVAIDHGAPPDRVCVIPNSVDQERFRRTSASRKTIDVLYVGRFSREKGIDTLEAAIARLPRDTVVNAVGEGPLRAGFQRRLAAAGCRVECPGWLTNRELPAVINAAKVQVVPSHSEPQGVVVIEAMSCGVPVIGSRVGGIPEMIDEGRTGWLVPAGAPDVLAGALRAALGDDSKRQQIADNALTASARFSTSAMEERLTHLYGAIMAGVRPGSANGSLARDPA